MLLLTLRHLTGNPNSLCISLLPHKYELQSKPLAGHQWLTPVILDTWEAEFGRIVVVGWPGQIVPETPSPK
jgi:hypothetical protein